MFGPFERAVAGRYLRARRGERFVSIIAIFSLIGIALGVATLIVVTSVMTGFQTSLVRRILGANGHITIEAYAGQKIEDYTALTERLHSVSGITSVLPVIDGQVLLTSERGGFRGGLVRGVTQADLQAMPFIGEHIVAGSLQDFAGDDAVAIGVSLADSFSLGIGSLITLTSPQGAATVIGTVPRIRAFKVVAIFDAGLHDYNANVVFLPMPMAQIYFRLPNAINSVQLRVADPEHFEQVLPGIRSALDGRQVLLRDWRHANDQIIGVLQVQKDTMFIVLGMIVLVAAFNVISSLIMLVKDKRADIAVLRTLGAGSGAILRIFLMCGAFVGVSGTLIGTLIGIVFCRNIVAIQHLVERISGGQVFDSSVFMLTALPSTIDWDGVVRVVLLGLTLSLLATLYPSWRAARTDPVEVLRSG